MKIKNVKGEVLLVVDRKDLRGVCLKGKNLRLADLRGATLEGADLSFADLTHADLSQADLYGSNLFEANLMGAVLLKADFRNTILISAMMNDADLNGALLSGSDLYECTMHGADLSNTVLDPLNFIPGLPDCFEEDQSMPGWVIGYRTRSTSSAGRYLVDNRIYGCEVFSTCQETKCHPGWYLWPTVSEAYNWGIRGEARIKVRTRREDGLMAGGKYRTRTIWVIGSV